MAPIPVIYLDANTVFRRLAVRVLERYFADEITVLSEGCTWSTVVPATRPEAVLFGLGSDGLVNPRLLAAIKATLPGVPVVVLGHLDDEAYRVAALAAGAAAFVAKGDLNTELIPLLRQLAGHEQPRRALR